MKEFIQLSSLEKVFSKYTKPEKEFNSISILKNERFAYQIAYTDSAPQVHPNKSYFNIKIDSPLSDCITIRQVRNVPGEIVTFDEFNEDDDYITRDPGLFPDPLFPLESDEIKVTPQLYRSLWITVDPCNKVPVGEYDINIVFECDDKNEPDVVKTMHVEIINAELPKQDLIFTQWFHTDCIAAVHKVPMFSEEHWRLIEEYVKTAVKNGINTIYTPIFTPPLDTKIGGERPTVQLIDVEMTDGAYKFGFSKLMRWLDMLKRCGAEYVEISHLFTQWGAIAAPKIVATVDGTEKRIFGWDTPATCDAYKNFLDAFLPELVSVLKAQNIDKKCIFHISDEPHGDAHLKSYTAAKDIVIKHLDGYYITDALSSYDFYTSGAVEHPVPCTTAIDVFLENKVPDLWTYYCCGQGNKVSNRFFAMPSYRNRAIGMQLYKFNIKGFLQWGYNFYYSQYSRKVINPFLVTDADGGFPAGDSFSVYPYNDGVLESLRLCVFYDALQDIRAFELLESFIGKDAVVELIEKETNTDITFESYPKSAELLLKLRKKVNEMIKSFI